MGFVIPEAELQFRTSRASGPGGQHVNKASTKVEVLWDIGGTATLSEHEKVRIIEQLGRRVDAQGVLHVTADSSRSQSRNREMAIERLQRLVFDALRPPKPRTKTQVPRHSREARLEDKKKQAEKKARRKPVVPSED